MRNFIVYNEQGKILRNGTCQDSTFFLQASNSGEFVIEGEADNVIQKVINVGVAGRIVDKTLEEIEAEKSPRSEPVPHEKRTAIVTNEQWQDVLKRLTTLEQPLE